MLYAYHGLRTISNGGQAESEIPRLREAIKRVVSECVERRTADDD